MKEFRFWLTACFFSVFIHFFIIAVLAFSAGAESKSKSNETISVDIKLLNISPALDETFNYKNLPAKPQQTFFEPKKDTLLVKNKPITPPVAQMPQTPAQTAQTTQISHDTAQTAQTMQPPAKMLESPSQGAQTPIISPTPATSADNISTGQTGAEGIPANGVPASGGAKLSKGGGKADRKAYPTYAPMPQYPVDARVDEVEGRVYIRVFLDETGKVLDAQITKSSGNSSLDNAALSCLRNWKFAPSYRRGIAVSDRIIVPVVFNMKQN